MRIRYHGRFNFSENFFFFNRRRVTGSTLTIFYYISTAFIFLFAFFVVQWSRIKRLKKVISSQSHDILKMNKDKEVLLQETQHRVKNNMQMISSLLSLQDRSAKNEFAKEALNKSKNRVKSIALIHQRLYSEERLGHFSAQEYIKSLSSSLFNAYKVDKDRVILKEEVDDLQLHIDTGIPVGLILNELLTNCLTYAFGDSQEGVITIRLKEKDKKLILEVEDSGSLLSPIELKERVGSFGRKMIETFGKKLDASLTLESDGANKVCLQISNYSIKA